MGWNAYGTASQLVPVGSKRICANPLAGLAVIDPDWPVVWSSICACRPFGVSCRLTCSRSPDDMKRSFPGFGVNVERVESIGFAGACDTPFRVTNANWKGSIPTLLAQVAF